MMAVKYKEKHFQRVLGNKRGKEFYKEFHEALKQGIKIIVKAGSTLPTDKGSQRSEAIELTKAGKLSNIDFFERMDYPNPKKMAQNLWLEENAPEELYPDLAKQMGAKKEQDAATMQAQTAAQAAPVPVTQVPTPNPLSPTPQAQDMGQQPTVQPTEHTEALLAGQEVQPFEGIESAQAEDHLKRELAFIGSDEFMQLPEDIQGIYAKHVVAEKELLEQQTGVQS